MATRRYYIDHDDTKPRKKNEYYEVREYNVKESFIDRYWEEKGRQTPQPNYRNYNTSRYRSGTEIQWYYILGGAILLLLLFVFKPPTGNMTVNAGSVIPSADGMSVTVTATVENTSGAMLFDLYCTAKLIDSEGNVFSQDKIDIAKHVLPGSKKNVTFILPTYGKTGAFKTKVEAKGKHIVWGVV